MKILWFVDKEFDVTLDRVSWMQALKYLQENHEVFLVTGYKREKPQFKELKNSIVYYEIPKFKFVKRFGLYFWHLSNYETLIRRFRPECIIFNTNDFLLIRKAAALRPIYRHKLYLDVRTLPVWPNRWKNALEGILFRNAIKSAAMHFDGVTYITETLRDYCQRKYNLPPYKTETWSSGVDLDVFKPGRNTLARRAFRIIYHGNFAENRGLDSVIRALSLIKDEPVELMLMGSGSGLRSLKTLVARLGLERRVIFYPPVSHAEVPRHIHEASIGILPFPNEDGWNVSSPIKLFEYLACGKPVIVTNIPAHINVVNGKEFAFWAENATPEAIAYAIIGAMNARHTFDRLVREARRFVEENFSWEKQAARLERFLLMTEAREDA